MALQECRKNAKLTQSELSAVSGVNLRTIQAYEVNKRDINNAGLDILCAFALSCRCTIFDILDNEQLKIRLKKVI